MSEIQLPMGMPGLDWSNDGVSGLVPTGTVTLLLADAEGSTRLWQTAPDEMTAAFGNLDRTLVDFVAAHHGVRPVEQGEGDSFVIAFARASDAVACALALQRAPLAPITLRIGVHTGEVQLRDEGNYIGPTINRTARLRELAHGGQTVLSGTTGDLVSDLLPDGAWLSDLGAHSLRDLPRSERVMQLCHPDICNSFPPLRGTENIVIQQLPFPLTSFVGRGDVMIQLRDLLAGSRLVTLTGAGGVGKTRLAVQLASTVADRYPGGVWFVDLAPITDPAVMPIAVARALGLPDQPGRSTTDTLIRFVRERRTLVMLDNCEHLLDAAAALIVELLSVAVGLTLLVTSREPTGIAGEVSWRVPSLSLHDEAIELFADRACHVRPGFAVGDDNVGAVAEICRRLDCVPLAIELAAARVRALSLAEILDSLHDRFRLLTGGARTAVRRQQTLRASVDWSHALLAQPECVLFRRLAVFLGSFDLSAAQAVGAGTDVERFQVLDQLSLLVDKSLVAAEEIGGGMRYRLQETVRQYAAEKLGESGEAYAVRSRHRDFYTALAAELDSAAATDYERLLERAEVDIHNLRGAFGWSRENDDLERALTLASSLQPLWQARGRLREGLSWYDGALADLGAQHCEVSAVVRARALANSALLCVWVRVTDSLELAQQALVIAREIDDADSLATALTVCGYIASYHDAEAAQGYFSEAVELARASDDRWRLSQVLAGQAAGTAIAGDPMSARAAAAEARDLADEIGDRFTSRRCRVCLGVAQVFQGDFDGAAAQFEAVSIESEAAHDGVFRVDGIGWHSTALVWQGRTSEARALADAAVEAAADLGGMKVGAAYWAVANAALAAGDLETARDASETAWQHWSTVPQVGAQACAQKAQAALASGDLVGARRWADEAVTMGTGLNLLWSLLARARVAIVQGECAQAERDCRDALAGASDLGLPVFAPDFLECLAAVAGDSHREAARLFGAAAGIRHAMGVVRFKVWDTWYRAAVSVLRDAMGENDFEAGWAEGATLSVDEAIAYAQRGRGHRKRPSSGWASLTPTECDVVRLVSEGLSNNDIATRLFVSPRTVQTHLTHVYNKLGVSSRVQLAQQAARTEGQSEAGESGTAR